MDAGKLAGLITGIQYGGTHWRAVANTCLCASGGDEMRAVCNDDAKNSYENDIQKKCCEN